jgi:HAMP domain-containing protein
VNTFGFRTLVLAAIASALVLATAMLGWLAYITVYDRILLGFNQKLLGISGTVGALTDGSGHADFQRPYVPIQVVPGPAGSAWGWDRTREGLVRIDLTRAAVVEYLSWPEAPLALLWMDADQRLLVQRADGSVVDSRAPERVLMSGADEPLLSDGERLYRLEGGRRLVETPLPVGPAPSVDPADPLMPSSAAPAVAGSEAPVSPVLQLPEPVRLLVRDRSVGQWVGLSEAGRLLAVDDRGQLLKSAELTLGDHRPVGLLADGERVWLAAEELLSYEWSSQQLTEDFEPGYYDESDPLVVLHAPRYRSLRERVGLTFLYTYVYIGGDRIRYILDGSVGDDHSPPGYLDSVPEADIDALVRAQVEGTPFVSGIRQWDAWGLVKVSAAPIIDADGRIVALCGADVDISVIRSKTRNALFAVLGVGALLLSVSGLVSLWVAQSVTRPLRDIKNAALRIAAGQYGARLDATGADEIGRLAGSLDRLSLRLLEQAEASSASQSALLSGRLDEALRASLRRELPQPNRLRLVGSDSEVLLLRSPSAVEDELEQTLRAGMLRALVRQMQATGTLDTDVLLQTDPALQLVLDWRPGERLLRWSARNVQLQARLADGSLHRLTPGTHRIPAGAVVRLEGESTC